MSVYLLITTFMCVINCFIGSHTANKSLKAECNRCLYTNVCLTRSILQMMSENFDLLVAPEGKIMDLTTEDHECLSRSIQQS